jgi:hypothetical protein
MSVSARMMIPPGTGPALTGTRQPPAAMASAVAARRDHFGIIFGQVPTRGGECGLGGFGWRGVGVRLVLHLLHGLLQGLVEVFRVDAEVFGGLLVGPGHGLLDSVFDLALANDDEACLAGVDEVTELFGAGP